jgi:hypothetical protein
MKQNAIPDSRSKKWSGTDPGIQNTRRWRSRAAVLSSRICILHNRAAHACRKTNMSQPRDSHLTREWANVSRSRLSEQTKGWRKLQTEKHRNLHTLHLISITRMRSEVLKAVKLSSLVFWIMIPCGLVGGYHRFRGTYCLHLRNWGSWIKSTPKTLFLFSRFQYYPPIYV